MTVKDKLLELHETNPNILVHLGAKSAFIAIDTPDGLLNRLDEITEYYRSSRLKRLKSVYGDIKVALYPKTNLSGFNNLTPNEIVEFAKYYGVDSSLIRSYISANKNLNKFQPFESREVIESYFKRAYPGFVILVHGSENGKYWTYTEQLIDMNGGKLDIEREENDNL